MEVKVVKPQHATPSEPSRAMPDSRRLRIMQFLTKTVSGSSLKEPTNSHASQNSSDGEDGEEETNANRNHSALVSSTFPLNVARPSLLQKLSQRLGKSESPPHAEEEKPETQGEGAHAWDVKKSVIEVSRGVAADIKGSFGRLVQMKGVLIEKLSSIPTIPADSLENARHSIESIVTDTTQSAYGKTKDAIIRIRLKLVEIIPSLSPHETKMIVDDAEREVNNMAKADASNGEQTKCKDRKEDRAAVAPEPTSAIAASMNRFKGLLQSLL